MYKSKFEKLFQLVAEDIGMDRPKFFQKKQINENIVDDEYNSVIDAVRLEYYNTLDTLSTKAAFLFDEYRHDNLYYSDENDKLIINNVFNQIAMNEHISIDEVKQIIENEFMQWRTSYVEKRKADALKWKSRYDSAEKIEQEWNNKYLTMDNHALVDYFKNIARNNKYFDSFREFKNQKMEEIFANKLTSAQICKNWGYANGWDQQTSTIFHIAEKKHEEMMKADPAHHNLQETHTMTGDHSTWCSCGFEYKVDSSD